MVFILYTKINQSFCFLLVLYFSNHDFFLFQVIALKVKRNGDWKTWTYERYLREVQLAARGFIHVGLVRHHSVAIIGQNSPEWVISDLAAIFSGTSYIYAEIKGLLRKTK